LLSLETHRGNRETIREGSYGRFLYNFYRTYDPNTGRYLEADPIGQAQGLNLFAYVESNPINRADPLGLFTYNKPPPATVPLPPTTKAMVDCLEKCLGIPLVVTGGAEKTGHLKGSKHGSGEAADFGFNSNPALPANKDKFFCCAAKCGFEYGEDDPTPPHFHIQIPKGKLGGSGLIPTLPNPTCTALGCTP
jgi:RHS repeat-associated protein